jgi:hypothetical protein
LALIRVICFNFAKTFRALKLFMILIGCKPEGRHTEQHDVFFGIAAAIKDLIPQMLEFWPEAGKLHVDGWREVRNVDGFLVRVEPATTLELSPDTHKLFFLNLGGYKEHEFEEYHYKMLAAATDKGIAVQKARQTAFYKHTGFTGATSHIDDKYGVDVDDIYAIEDILPAAVKQQYRITLMSPSEPIENDVIHLGYFKLGSL